MFRSMSNVKPSPAALVDPVQITRRERIVAAAESQFAAYGFRRVSMESAAEAAQVAKATLYSYFRSKDLLFEAVASRLATNLTGAFEAGLNQPASLRDRIMGALLAKHRIVFALVRGSPHAAELFSAKDRLARNMFAEADARMVSALARAIAETAGDQASPAHARNLFFGFMGVANHVADADLEAALGGFIDTYLRGAIPGHHQNKRDTPCS